MSEKQELQLIAERNVSGNVLKIYGTFEKPLFLAKDVAEWIDYSKTGDGKYDVSTMLSTIDDDEKGTNIVRTPGGPQKAWFLTEDGVYEVLMQSRKVIAKVFKKEIKALLRTIRKTGIYVFGDVRWKVLRGLAAEHFKVQNWVIHNDKLRDEKTIELTKHSESGVQADNADMLNLAVFGYTASEWKKLYPEKAHGNKNQRDYGTDDQLLVLTVVEIINSFLILYGIEPRERLDKLRAFAQAYLSIMNNHNSERLPRFSPLDITDFGHRLDQLKE